MHTGVCEMSPLKNDKIVAEKDEGEEFPPGWILEVKKRTSGSRTIVDRRYTDPVTGYIFHSLKDAQRYLKTGELGRLASPPDTKTSRLSTRQAAPLVGTEADPSPPSLPQPKTRRATRQAGVKIVSPPPSPPDTRNNRQAQRARLVNSATRKENDKKIEAVKMTDKQNENADMDNNPNNNQEHNKETEMGPATLPVVDPTVPQDASGYGGDMKSDSSDNFSLNDLWSDPCIEFAVKTLTGAIPFGDLTKHENMLPTPSKAIPVGEDDHLQDRSVSDRNPRAPHEFYQSYVGMGFCQTDVLSKKQDPKGWKWWFAKTK